MTADHLKVTHGVDKDRFEDAIESDLLDLLYRNLLISQWSSLAVALVFAGFFWESAGVAPTFGWLAYMALVAMVRMWLFGYYQHNKARLSYQRGERLFFGGVLAAGLGWSMAAVLFFNPDQLPEQMLLVGSLAGLTAGSIVHLSPSIRAANTFLVLGLAPLVFVYLSQPSAERGLGVLTLAYLLMMLFVVRRANRFMRDNAALVHGNRHLMDLMMSHSEALEDAKAQNDVEQEMALSVFQAIMPLSALSAENITFHLSSHSAFNGDLLLVETRPDGRQNVMLGDFTGHGLAASLGAIPVADIFASMSRKGFPLNVIAGEINRKLYAHLPANLFCAACLAEIDPVRSRVRVWNGGLPSVYLLDGVGGKITHKIQSTHPPLGILPPAAFDDSVVNLTIKERDQLFMATDGLIEQRNMDDQMFGEHRLERILDDVIDIRDLADALRAEIVRFCKGVGQGDDMTFVAVRAESSMVPHFQVPAEQLSEIQEPDWSFQLQLKPSGLRRLNPVPVLNHLIQEFNGSHDESMHLELVLGELYKNALDHGVLGLDSAKKHSADGFDDYYRLRQARLDELQDGSVVIDIINHRGGKGGLIELEVRDSGEGFEHQAVADKQASDVEVHGRGIPLARALCRELTYVGKGNQVRAEYPWQSSS